MVVPYTKGHIESFKNICNKHGIHLLLKGDNTNRKLLVAPKDKETSTEKTGVIYRYNEIRGTLGNLQDLLEKGLKTS